MSMDTMNHDEAVSSHAVERYVLGQLSGAERESFEGHYFDCPVCFEQISVDGRLMAQFLGHAREVLDPEPEKSWLAQMLGDLRRPAPIFASALLLCTLGIGVYQQSVISDFRAPHNEVSYFLTEKRGVNQVTVPRKTRLSLRVPVVPKPEFVSYQAQMVAEPSGKIRRAFPVVPAADDSVTIGLRADALAPGQYSVVVQGVAKDGTLSEAGRGGPFELKLAD